VDALQQQQKKNNTQIKPHCMCTEISELADHVGTKVVTIQAYSDKKTQDFTV